MSRDPRVYSVEEAVRYTRGDSLSRDVSSIVSSFGLDQSVSVRAEALQNRLHIGDRPGLGSQVKGKYPMDRRLLAAFLVGHCLEAPRPEVSLGGSAVGTLAASPASEIVLILPPGTCRTLEDKGGQHLPRWPDARGPLERMRAYWQGSPDELKSAKEAWGKLSSDLRYAPSEVGSVDIVVLDAAETIDGFNRSSKLSERRLALESIWSSVMNHESEYNRFLGIPADEQHLMELRASAW